MENNSEENYSSEAEEEAVDLRSDSRKGSPSEGSEGSRSSSSGSGAVLPYQQLYPQIPKRRLLRLHRKIPPLFQELVSEGPINEDSADVHFLCQDGQVAKGHRIILALSSPFFTALFRKQKPSRNSFVSIPEASAKTITSILNLCYKEQVLLDSDQELEDAVYWLQQFGFIRNNVHGVDQFWPAQHIDFEHAESSTSWLRSLLGNETTSLQRNFKPEQGLPIEGLRGTFRNMPPPLADMRPRNMKRKSEIESRRSNDQQITYWIDGSPTGHQQHPCNPGPSTSAHQPIRYEAEERWMCPFCNLLFPNCPSWNHHVMACTSNRRRSGRQTSDPVVLRDYVTNVTFGDKKPPLERTIKKKALKVKGRKSAAAAAGGSAASSSSSSQKTRAYRAAETRNFRQLPKIPEDCIRNAENADEQERIRWLYVCLKCQLSLDSSIKAHDHWSKCNVGAKYENSVIKYRQGYYGAYLCPLCTRRYTTIFGFVVHCIHNHVEYKKLLSHVISEDKIMCTNCGDKFFGPQEFHAHLGPNQYCEKPPKEHLMVKRKAKKASSGETTTTSAAPASQNPEGPSSRSSCTSSSTYSGSGHEDGEESDDKDSAMGRDGQGEDREDSDMVIHLPSVRRGSQED